MSDAAPWPSTRAHSGGVVLRRCSEADVECVLDMAADPYIPTISTLAAGATREQALAWIAAQQTRLDAGYGYSLCIAHAETNQALGYCGLWIPEHHVRQGRATVGYSIAPPHRGKGYAEAALRLLVRFAWTLPDVHRVEARIEPWNVASQRTAEKAGFSYEGTLRSHQVINGQRVDMQMWACLRP